MLTRDMPLLQEQLFQELLNKKASGYRIVFWGCGMNARNMLPYLLEKEIVPDCFCYTNPGEGEIFQGFSVKSYEGLKKEYSDYIIVLLVSTVNAVEIKNYLHKQGEKNAVYSITRPFKVECELLSAETFRKHYEAYEKAYCLLEDQYSKDLMEYSLFYKLTGNGLEFSKWLCGDSFFDMQIVPADIEHVYVDIGAYTGDTVFRFCVFTRGRYQKIIAIEPDSQNFKALQSFVKFGRLENVHLVNKGGWRNADILNFYTLKTQEDIQYDSSNFYYDLQQNMDVYYNALEEKHILETTVTKVPVDSLDHILEGEKATLIKINALAADYPILEGCSETIKKYKPCIIIEYGTQEEGLWKIPLLIKELRPDYKLYLREKKILGDEKTVLYAV